MEVVGPCPKEIPKTSVYYGILIQDNIVGDRLRLKLTCEEAIKRLERLGYN